MMPIARRPEYDTDFSYPSCGFRIVRITRHEQAHRVRRACTLYHAHALLRRVVLVRQIFAEDARRTADDSLGSMSAAIDLISWGQPHGHMAFINTVHRAGHFVFVFGSTRKLLPGMSRGRGS